MVLLKGKWLIKISLSCTWLVLVVVPITYAAILKDVRLGDHDAFTRVVLEFDSSITLPAEDKDAKGLVLTFSPATAGLVRKIPSPTSSRITKLTLWEKQQSLAIQITFNFQQFRYEFLELSDPYRLVIDIFPRNNWDAEENTVSWQTPNSIFLPDVQDNSVATSEFSLNNDEPEILRSPSLNIPSGAKATTASSLSQSDHIIAETRRLPTQTINPKKSLNQNRAKWPSLQFYLIVGLVVITIAILSFAFIFLARYRWSDDAPRENINDLLKKQEAHIASINARIQEQLKRYDEA